jgi:hypothetical protein
MGEGGAIVITSFIRLKLVDLFVITVAPKLVGWLPVIDTRRIKNASHLALTDIYYQRLGGELVVWARPIWSNDEAKSYFSYAAISETKIIAEAMLGVGLAEGVNDKRQSNNPTFFNYINFNFQPSIVMMNRKRLCICYINHAIVA